jgi:hypothetical protein
MYVCVVPRTFTNPRVCLVLFVQWSKGCLVRSDINKGVFQKVAYVRVVPRTSAVLFTECTSGGPHTNILAKNSGTLLLDLAYVQLQMISI